MESKNEFFLKKNNKRRACYYFVDIMKVIDIDFENISLHKKSYKNKNKNILIHDISLVHNNCVFGLIKKINLLKFIVELDS